MWLRCVKMQTCLKQIRLPQYSLEHPVQRTMRGISLFPLSHDTIPPKQNWFVRAKPSTVENRHFLCLAHPFFMSSSSAQSGINAQEVSQSAKEASLKLRLQYRAKR